MQALPDPFDAEEATIKSAARGARADRDRLALQAIRQPDNKVVADDLKALEAELDGYRVSLERIAGARRARAAAALADTQEARQAKFDEHRKAAIAAVGQRAKAASALDQALNDLEAALIAEATAGAEAWAAVTTGAKLMEPTTRGATAGLQGVALGDLSPVLSRLNRALCAAEALGSRLGHYVDVRGFHDPCVGIVEVATQEASRLTEALGRLTLQPPAATPAIDEFADASEAA